MNSTVGLDDLLGRLEPHATFHDADLLSIRVDYEKQELVAHFRICVGDPDASDATERERRRDCRLTFQGLTFWAIEPPSRARATPGALWLTGEGPLSEAPSPAARELAAGLPPDMAGWYLYFSDLNSFAYVASKSAEFEWV